MRCSITGITVFSHSTQRDSLYSKLFASILDSSVWLEPLPTRVVWLTLLAAKDSDGFARFASVENLARRAIVDIDQAEAAIAVLESPDLKSSNPAHEGRRVERVPGGWMVLNAGFYDDLVRRDDERRMNRDRVRRHREKHKGDAEEEGELEAPPRTPDARVPPPPPEIKDEQVLDVLRLVPTLYCAAVEGALRAHRNPPALVAELKAIHEGMHGKPQDWATIGRAVHDMQVAGAAMTSRTLRAFCDGVGVAPPSRRLSKQEIGRQNLADAIARREREGVSSGN